MAIKCPKCHSENPETNQFCADCGTKLPSFRDAHPEVTETLRAPVHELTTGVTFAERYQIIEELGKGGMGKVYKVFDQEVRAKMALKLIKPEVSADKNTIDRFRNELKIARDISHKNICRMYDLGREADNYFITMEYVPGEDLKSTIIRVGQLSVGKTIFIVKQVCEGLTEAHRLGVVHRDLKPQNIMIDREGNARIMDFGIARSLKAKGITDAGVMIGTPEYMSPEQVEGKDADQRADIYALGIILYEMVTGKVPFEGDTPFSIAYKQKNEAPPDPRKANIQIPEDLSRLILHCLEKDKTKRYQSTEEIFSELTKIEKGIPTTEKVIPKRRAFTSKEITVTLGVKKLFIPISIVLALVLMAIVIWQVIPHKEPAKRSVAVISFKNQTGDKAFDYLQEAIPNLLITSLEQSKYLRVATWERLHDLLAQMGKKDVPVITEELGFEACRQEGIEAVVLGSFVKAGEMFATDVKVLDVNTKKLLKSASSRGEGVQSILEKQIDELSRNISRGIGISEQKIGAAQPRIAEVTTSSMEAYNFFLRGRDDFDKFYYDDARKFLEKAVELDPKFSVAYLFLAQIYYMLRNDQAMKEAYENAKKYSEKATEKERLYIEASYATAVENNEEKRFRLLKQIAEKYPDEKRVHYELGLYYHYNRKMFSEAIAEYNKALQLDPSFGVVLNSLAYVYADSGNFEKSIEYLEKYASVSPGDANPLDSMAEVYFKMGKLDEAIAKYKEALEVKPDFYQSISRICYIYALKEDYTEAVKWTEQLMARAPSPLIGTGGLLWKNFYLFWLGVHRQSLSQFDLLVEERKSAGDEEAALGTDWIKSWIYYDRGEVELGQKCMDSYFDYFRKKYPAYVSDFSVEYSFYFGLVDLKSGRIDSAKSRLAEMESLLPKVQPFLRNIAKSWRDILEGEMLLAENDPDRAIAFFQSAADQEIPNFSNIISYNIPFHKDGLARAYLKKGEKSKAIAAYEQLVVFDPMSKSRLLIYPRYHFQLAKLYEDKGLREKAIVHYRKFLEIWKDADKDLPELAEAKKRLADLEAK